MISKSDSASTTPDPDIDAPAQRPKVVVVIDDNADHMAITVWSLVAVGFKCMGFTDGLEALSFLKNHSSEVQAVISDLSLPLIDGLTITEEIRRNEQAFALEPLPIAFFTAHDQTPGGATERIAERNQVERIWHKPKDVQTIGSLVKGWLASRNLGYMTAVGENH